MQFIAWIKRESRQNYEFWIGLTDSKQEGVYEWKSGGALPHHSRNKHWLSGEPNNYRGNQHCVQMEELKMNDKDCSYEKYFVCERRNVTGGGGSNLYLLNLSELVFGRIFPPEG